MKPAPGLLVIFVIVGGALRVPTRDPGVIGVPTRWLGARVAAGPLRPEAMGPQTMGPVLTRPEAMAVARA